MPPKPAKLFVELRRGERLFFGLCQRDRGGLLHGMTRLRPARQLLVALRRAHGPQSRAAVGIAVVRAGEGLAQSPVQFRIARFPKFVANVDAFEIDVAIAEIAVSHCFAPFDFAPRKPARPLPSVRMARVEHHAIAGFQRRFKLQHHVSSRGSVSLRREKRRAFFQSARAPVPGC